MTSGKRVRQQIQTDKYLFALRCKDKYFYVGVSENPYKTVAEYLTHYHNVDLRLWLIEERKKYGENHQFILEMWDHALLRKYRDESDTEPLEVLEDTDTKTVIWIDIFKFIPLFDNSQGFTNIGINTVKGSITIGTTRTEKNELIREMLEKGHPILNKVSGRKK